MLIWPHHHLPVPFYFYRISGWHSLDELLHISEKSQNGDTLGPVEKILQPEQGDLGDRDWYEQDDEDEVSISFHHKLSEYV